MNQIEELRAQMRAAQVFGKGQYLQEEGRYDLEVLKGFYKRTVIEGTQNENMIMEFTVLSSSNSHVEVGATRSCVFSFKHAGWLSRFKALMLALQGVDPDGRVPPEAATAVDDLYVALRVDAERIRLQLPENFLAGLKVKAEAIPGKSRKGGDITNIKWMPFTA